MKHNPVAIWRQRNPYLGTVHFVSDRPATQYRQKFGCHYQVLPAIWDEVS